MADSDDDKTPGDRVWDGPTLARLRRDSHLTQGQIAWLLQTTRQAVSGAERGSRKVSERWRPWLDVLADLVLVEASRYSTFGPVPTVDPGPWSNQASKTRPAEWARLVNRLDALRPEALPLPGKRQ